MGLVGLLGGGADSAGLRTTTGCWTGGRVTLGGETTGGKTGRGDVGGDGL